MPSGSLCPRLRDDHSQQAHTRSPSNPLPKSPHCPTPALTLPSGPPLTDPLFLIQLWVTERLPMASSMEHGKDLPSVQLLMKKNQVRPRLKAKEKVSRASQTWKFVFS